jgi:quercetin dioxygenase-like cupin family protein
MQDVSNRFNNLLGKFEIDLGIKHHFSSGVYAKEMLIPKDHIVGTHSHTFDHLSLLASGKVILKTDDSEQSFTAPAVITIVKNKNHEIYAIEDSVWFCIHATNETDPSTIDEVLISKKGE